MLANTYCSKIIVLVIIGSIQFCLNAQTTAQTSKVQKSGFHDLRDLNVFDVGMGSSVINGDLMDPKFEIYFHAGYKRYFLPHFNINLSYNKFNLAYTDIYNEGFMSFDLNLESTILPHCKLSPFVFVGGGYNAANYFEQDALKLQAGGGLEYIVAEGFGLKLFADYNQVMSDELDGLIAGASDDTYIRMGMGLNYYFGGKKKKTKNLKNQETIINSNQIISHN